MNEKINADQKKTFLNITAFLGNVYLFGKVREITTNFLCFTGFNQRRRHPSKTKTKNRNVFADKMEKKRQKTSVEDRSCLKIVLDRYFFFLPEKCSPSCITAPKGGDRFEQHFPSHKPIHDLSVTTHTQCSQQNQTRGAQRTMLKDAENKEYPGNPKIKYRIIFA